MAVERAQSLPAQRAIDSWIAAFFRPTVSKRVRGESQAAVIESGAASSGVVVEQ